MDDELCNILRAADKHPNSRVAKLVRSIQDEPNQKNIVLLLMEIAQHNEYSVDFKMSLSYYINLFEQLGLNHDMILNDAGLLLVNLANIYGRRVDCVHDLVEQQLLSLNDADKVIKEKKKKIDESTKLENENTEDTNKIPVKRGRKRVLDVPIHYNEIELVPKKVRKLTAEKRFSLTDKKQCPSDLQMKLNRYRCLDVQQYIHPTSWLHGTIYDLENNDEVDNKRNYKMFTHHVEHRYNTLVPDINFRLHFKMKDFIEEENDRLQLEEAMQDSCHMGGRKWPPLSEDYIEQYIDLENRILGQKSYNNDNTVQSKNQSSNLIDSAIRNEDNEGLETSQEQKQQQQHENESINSTTDSQNVSDEIRKNDSTINLDKVNLSGTIHNETCETNQNSKRATLGSEGYHSLSNTEISLNDTTLSTVNVDSTLSKKTNDLDDCEIDLKQIRIRLPHLDDEGVYISDLDEYDQKMLSPKVVATDVFPLIPDKENIRIIINDEIRTMFNIRESPTKHLETTTTTTIPASTPRINLNVCKLPEKLLRKRALFKLGPDMKMYTEARSSKRPRIENETITKQNRQLQCFPLNNTDFTDVQITPLNSPGHNSDLYGFTSDEDVDAVSNASFEMDFLGFSDYNSRDSGLFMDIHGHTLDLQIGVDDLNVHTESNGVENGNITTEHVVNENQPNESEKISNPEMIESNIVIEGTEVPTGELNENVQEINEDVQEQEMEQNVPLDDLELMDNSRTETKVQEWHNYLRPILEKSRERHHFDVFQLGTEIIETIQRKNNKKDNDNSNSDGRLDITKIQNETEMDTGVETISQNHQTINKNNTPMATFMDIMEDKDQTSVSRYFLSTLLLINQNNLELLVDIDRKIGEKPIEWDNIVLKLKSTKRYSVAVEDNIGLLDKNIAEKVKEKNSTIHDRNMSYCKNVALKRVNATNNNIMNKHETHNNTNINENNVTEELRERIASTPLHNTNKNLNNSWNQVSRISNIMPSVDGNSNAALMNSTHFQNSYECTNNDEEQYCNSSRTNFLINKPSLSSMRLKTIVPIPSVLKVSRHCETDSGIFSNDDYRLIS